MTLEKKNVPRGLPSEAIDQERGKKFPKHFLRLGHSTH